MSAWTIKTETYDPDLALEIVRDQQAKGYTAWIEHEHGNAVDEDALRMHRAEPTKSTLAEKLQDYLLVWHPARLLSAFFMWLDCGLMVGIKPCVSSGSFAELAAIRRASSLVSIFAVDRRPGSLSHRHRRAPVRRNRAR
jgi:hypothetical protein